VLAAARDLRERSFGPATAKYRELGTLANLLAFNAISALPTRNFRSATFEGAARLGADAGTQAAGGEAAESEYAGSEAADAVRPPTDLAEMPSDVMHRVARSGCASCTIGCEHIYRVGGGKKARVEYENVFALDPMCGVAVNVADVITATGAERPNLGERADVPASSVDRS